LSFPGNATAIENGEFQKLAGPTDTPAFSDMSIESGKRYRYAVTALDQTGNESARSAPAEAIAQ
jgi:fibronectin type 3 domain-containing protein